MSTHLDQQPNILQAQRKGPLNLFKKISPRMRVVLAITIIFILVIFSFFAPKEGDSNNVTGDLVPTTIAITNPVGTSIVNRSVQFSGIQFTVTKVEEAAAFSDDRKRGGLYTVRVHLMEKNSGQNAIGIDYSSSAHLLLSNGEEIAPKLIALSPAILPNQNQGGFFDFPVSTRVPLTSLTLRLDCSGGASQNACTHPVRVAFG